MRKRAPPSASSKCAYASEVPSTTASRTFDIKSRATRSSSAGTSSTPSRTKYVSSTLASVPNASTKRSIMCTSDESGCSASGGPITSTGTRVPAATPRATRPNAIAAGVVRLARPQPVGPARPRGRPARPKHGLRLPLVEVEDRHARELEGLRGDRRNRLLSSIPQPRVPGVETRLKIRQIASRGRRRSRAWPPRARRRARRRGPGRGAPRSLRASTSSCASQ